MKDFWVRRMFDDIAFSYDFQNSFLSLRRDSSWRSALAESLRIPKGGLVLDAASGTAEVAIEIGRRHPGSSVVAVDFSDRMLIIGKAKVIAKRMGNRIHCAVGDGRRLPLRSGVFDAATIAFGIRNIEERRMALKEFFRVLKTGAKLLVMEFGYPKGPLLGWIYRLYFHHVLPPLGNRLSRTEYAYTYLAESVAAFPEDDVFLEELASEGFTDLHVRRLTWGIAKIYSGVKTG